MLLRASPPVLEKRSLSHEAVARYGLHGEAVARGGLHDARRSVASTSARVEPAADDVVVLLRQVLHRRLQRAGTVPRGLSEQRGLDGSLRRGLRRGLALLGL